MPSPDPALEMPRSVPADRSPSPQRATWIVILVVILTGSLAAAAAWRYAERGADTREVEAADSVHEALDGAADDLVVAVSGTSVLIGIDGSVTQAGVDRFALDVSESGTPRPVAWLLPVAGTDPPAWSVALSTTGPGNASDPAALLGMEPGTELAPTSTLAEAATRALRSGRPSVTGFEDGDGTARLAVMKPVYRLLGPESAEPILIGVVMTADAPGQMSRSIGAQLPDGVRYRISDGDSVLATSDPAPTGGVTDDVTVDGHRLTAQVEDRRTASHELSWFLLWITAVIVAAAGVVGLRSARYDRERRRTNAMIGRTAELARHLALAATADEVADVISIHVPALFGADVASFGEVDEEAGVVRLHLPDDVDPATAEQLRELRLADVPSLAEALSAGSIVLLQDEADWRRELPAEAAERLRSGGARAAAVLPLEAPGGDVVATVGIVWWRPPDFDERTTATLETVRELCEQSLARAALTDRVSARASHLAELAERLAGVDSVADTAHTVTSMVIDVVGASAASVGVRDDDEHVLRVHHGDTIGGRALEVFAHLPLEAPLAFTEVARTGAPLMFADLESYAARYPDTDVANRDLGLGGRAAFPLRADDRVIGSIVFAWDRSVDFDDDLVNELTTVAEITAQSVRRAQLIEQQAAEAERSRAMAELAQGLAARADTADIAGFLTESVLAPLGAVFSVVGVLDGDRLLRRYSRSLVETGLVALGQDYLSSALETRTPATDAARDGTTVFVTEREDGYERYPEMAPVWDALGVQAGAAAPVKDRAGRVVATISVLWDRTIVVRDDLRDTLATVAGMVGQTLERTGLVDELRRSAERNQAMADFARALANVRSIEELCRSVVAGGARPVGAVLADVALFAEDGTVLPIDGAARVAVAAPTSDDGGPHRGDRDPLQDCVRLREPVVLDRVGMAAAFDAATLRVLDDAGVARTAHLPLVAPDGSVLGVIAVGWDAPEDPAPTIPAKLRTLAELCSQTLQRTRLREAEHRLVVSLQERVVRPVPALPGLRIAERYLPASAQVGMGGDWFEGIEIDEHRFAVVVGDIAGHGINAVADMVELRAIIGSLLRSATPLEEVYPQVAALLRQRGSGLTATSCTAVFDTTADTIRYVSAGHLPPVLAQPDGTVELLEHGRQPLLGVPSSAVTPGSAPFPPGSVLALYTDGIVERRREPIDVSLSRLTGAMADVLAVGADGGPDVESVADGLIERCLGERTTDDDVALVVVARLD